nr:hypothetical protein [Nitrosomonas nitrosa]
MFKNIILMALKYAFLEESIRKLRSKLCLPLWPLSTMKLKLLDVLSVVILCALISALLSGCASLNSVKVNSGNESDIRGVIYYLPESEFSISITRSLKSCAIETDPAFQPTGVVQSVAGSIIRGDPKAKFKTEFKAGDWLVLGYQARKVLSVTDDSTLTTIKPFTLNLGEPTPYEKPADSIPKVSVVTEMQATVDAKIFPAKDHTYLIDFASFSSGLKQTALTIDLYDNGTLKGINGSITDKTAEVLEGLVKSGVAIARMVMGLPSPAAGETIEAVDSLCTPEVSQNLMALGTLNRSLKTLTRQRDIYIATIQKIELLLTDQSSRAELNNILTILDNSQKQLEVLEGKRKQIIGRLSAVSHEQFKPTFDIKEKRFSPPDEVLYAWFKRQDSRVDEAKNKLTAVATIQVITDPPGSKLSFAKSCDKGLVYRNPAHAILHICQEQACIDASGNAVQGAEVLHKLRTVVPQLGKLARLPLRSLPFQTKTLTAAFATDGTLTKASSTSEAAAEKAAAALAASLPSVIKLLDDQKLSDVKNIKRETERYQAEFEREKARRELQELLNDR